MSVLVVYVASIDSGIARVCDVGAGSISCIGTVGPVDCLLMGFVVSVMVTVIADDDADDDDDLITGNDELLVLYDSSCDLRLSLVGSLFVVLLPLSLTFFIDLLMFRSGYSPFL